MESINAFSKCNLLDKHELWENNWSRKVVFDKYFTTVANILDNIEERMGPETIELLLMEPDLLGYQFLTNVMLILRDYTGQHKQKKVFRDWLFRHDLRFDRVRLYLDNILSYFTMNDMDCISDGILDTKVYTERGFNPKICHYSCNLSVKKVWTEANLRFGMHNDANASKSKLFFIKKIHANTEASDCLTGIL